MLTAELEERLEDPITEYGTVDARLRGAAISALESWRFAFGGQMGAIIVLGYDKASMTDYVLATKRDLANTREYNIYCKEDVAHLGRLLCEEDDGAVLADNQGKVIHTGQTLLSNPKRVLKQMNIPNHRPSAIRFGLANEAGHRHIFSAAASYEMSVEVLVLSQSDRSIHGFSKGMVIYSENGLKKDEKGQYREVI